MESEKTFDVLYYKTAVTYDDPTKFIHKYTETWTLTGYCCPRCGTKDVWSAACGDYYKGEQHICTNCKATFYMPDGICSISGPQDVQRLDRLKALPEPVEG